MDLLLAESFDRFLAGCCAPAVVREVERTHQARALWAELQSSGYLDLLLAEASGGAGLGLRDAFPILLACGRQALPVPMAATMWLRGALAQAGLAAPQGPLSIASQCARGADASIRCQGVPFGALADWVLVVDGVTGVLLPVAQGQRQLTGVHGSLQAHVSWSSIPADALRLAMPSSALAVGALLTATTMAGAMLRVLEATLAYANDRAQFGKAIGKFQAVQQQLSVMAEQVFAARMAAEMGCAAAGIAVQPLRAAVAKARASEAAEKVVAIAHAVHGAIGITAEFDLQLHTRRLQEWRADFGSPAFWHAQLGSALLAAPGVSTLAFMLERLVSGDPP